MASVLSVVKFPPGPGNPAIEDTTLFLVHSPRLDFDAVRPSKMTDLGGGQNTVMRDPVHVLGDVPEILLGRHPAALVKA